jgi:hypothetical protein
VLDADRVYWTNEGPYDVESLERPPEGRIVSMAKAGGAPVVLADGEQRPLAIAASGDYLYFADGRYRRTGPAMIRRIAKSGGPILTIAPERDEMRDPQIAVVGDRVVWNETYAVMFAPVIGGAPERLGRSGPFAADERGVYVAEAEDRHLAIQAYTPLPHGGEPAMIASRAFLTGRMWFARAVALDAADVYWLDYQWSYADPHVYTAIRAIRR